MTRISELALTHQAGAAFSLPHKSLLIRRDPISCERFLRRGHIVGQRSRKLRPALESIAAYACLYPDKHAR